MNANPGRTKARDLELVIARDIQPCEWSTPYAHRRTMYQKGPEFVTGAWALPDVGRDAHTYLTHIVRNYDDLAEMTVFLSTDVGDQGITIEDFFNQDREFIAGSLRALDLSDAQNMDERGHIRQSANLLSSPERKDKQAATMPFGAWFDRTISHQIGQGLAFTNTSRLFLACTNGNFSVHKSCILDKPKSYYESLLRWVSEHRNPEWADYVHLSWLYIFMPATERNYRIGVAGCDFDAIELGPTRCGMPRHVFSLIFGKVRRAS